MPVSSEEKELVLRELESILSSHHFRGSKRYPALLKYVVDAALEGRAGDLKERTLGVEVFGRLPGYDTNADPVVRISAAEVRKRIAQFYHEQERRPAVRIELPVGSYVPEFILHVAETQVADAASQTTVAIIPSVPSTIRWISLRSAALVLMGMSIALAAAQVVPTRFYRRAAADTMAVTDQLWRPMLGSNRPVLIVVGPARPDSIDTTPVVASAEKDGNPYPHFSAPSAIALAHLAGLLQQHGASFQIKEPEETSLADIRARPLALIGAINNGWTMRLVSGLPIHFDFGQSGVSRIVDARNPQQVGWAIDRARPYSSLPADYAIVARFRDDTTEGPVIVAAGLGAYGTEAAGEFVESPDYLKQLAAALPRGWEEKNVEVVIRTDVIDGKVGPPVLLKAISW